MRNQLLYLILLAAASANAEMIIAPGLDIDAGARYVQIPSGMSVGVIDTGSGSVRLAENAGAQRIDTGSGDVRLGAEAVSGDIDTGSGSVSLDVGARAGMIDTGSGSVDLADRAASGGIDTGSGSVDIGVQATVDGDIDTGSGSVRIKEGSRVNGKIDTGSGDVDLRGVIVKGPVDVGSGNIRLADVAAESLAVTSGDITLSGSTRIAGELRIRKRKCWGLCWGGRDPVVRVGPGVVIDGKIIVEDGAKADISVDPAAKVGGVIGATVRGLAERNE